MVQDTALLLIGNTHSLSACLGPSSMCESCPTREDLGLSKVLSPPSSLLQYSGLEHLSSYLVPLDGFRLYSHKVHLAPLFTLGK